MKTASQLILESTVGNYSPFIDKLVRLGEERYGLTIDLFAFKLSQNGRIHYNKKLIEINVPDAKNALMTIAHEIGHWIGYLKNSSLAQDSFTVEEREGFAQRYGWEVIQQVGADNVISEEDWARF